MAPPIEPSGPPAHRNGFLPFLTSLFLSKIADQILLFLVPLVVFQATSDVRWSGLAFALEAFPRFLSFPVCGALCDRISPTRLLRWSQIWRAAVCILGAACSEFFGGIGWLVAISAICGVLTTQGVMAREVILPQAFRSLRFERVLAYSQTADQAGAVLGPVVAALLLTVTHWQMVVGLTALMFLMADLAMARWRAVSTAALQIHAGAPQGWLRTLKVAFGHIFFIKGLNRLVIQASGVNLVVGVTLASSAALFTGIHGESVAHYGILQTGGALLTVAILMAIAHVAVPVVRLGLAAFLLIALGGFLTATGSGPWGYGVGYLCVIGFDKMFNIYMRSTRQRLIPAADYGKTTGVMTMLNNLTQPVAGLAIGLFAGRWTATTVIAVLTAAMVVLGALSMRVRTSDEQTSPT